MELSKETIHIAAHQVALEAARKDIRPAVEYIDVYERIMKFLVDAYKEIESDTFPAELLKVQK